MPRPLLFPQPALHLCRLACPVAAAGPAMKLANFRNIAYLAVMCVTPVILTLGFVTDR